MMFEIPQENLPEGFAETVDRPPAEPASPRPAATTVVLRDGDTGPEVLLLRRHRSSRFVPGAWVFPGGRVDAADSGPPLYERITGLAAGITPEAAFWVAALRELFEETGVLIARHEDGRWAADASTDRRLERMRHGLMDDRLSLLEVLEDLDVVLDTGGMVHMAHWITPVVEPRRYDTHFFAAALPAGRQAEPDPREMTEAAWLTPRAALRQFGAGRLPMVFPTVKTLESLAAYESVEHALDALRNVEIPRLLPRLVRTPTGVGIVLD